MPIELVSAQQIIELEAVNLLAIHPHRSIPGILEQDTTESCHADSGRTQTGLIFCCFLGLGGRGHTPLHPPGVQSAHAREDPGWRPGEAGGDRRRAGRGRGPLRGAAQRQVRHLGAQVRRRPSLPTT